MSRKLRPLAALAIVALIGAGCSNESAEDDNAGNTNAASQGPGVKFAECMRDNGVSEFPDPDASGELTIDGVVNGSGVDPDAPAWQQAINACKDLQPPGFTGPEEYSSQEQAERLEFAQCIRENGVEDFPDPTPNGPMVDTNRIPSAAGAGGMDILNAAMETCGDIIAGQLGR